MPSSNDAPSSSCGPNDERATVIIEVGRGRMTIVDGGPTWTFKTDTRMIATVGGGPTWTITFVGGNWARSLKESAFCSCSNLFKYCVIGFFFIRGEDDNQDASFSCSWGSDSLHNILLETKRMTK